MKVPESIGDIFDRHVEEVRRLASSAEGLIRGHLHKEWHFVSWVKDRESFALKIETGRVSDPGKLEDFYACTIVVRNNAEITEVERIINELFEVGIRRPPRPNYTHSDPSSFDFDHLRLYAAWKPDEALPPTGLEGRLFEVQIKTYLQHAWSIATHDLVYKTDDVNWRKARVAYQVKAMLEHAETSIAYAANFADIAEIQMENRSLDELRKVIEVLKEEWRDDPARLPRDIRRLAESVLSVIKSIGMTPEVLRTELAEERAAGRGALVETLSPYGVVLETLLNRRLPDLQRFLTDRSSRSRRTKIVFASEVSYRGKIDPAACQNGIFINTTPAA